MPEFDKAGSMQAFVDDAVKKGAQVVNESGGTGCETLFFPAVVYPVRPGMELRTKEQFGPVVPVCTYEDEQEFLDYVTQSGQTWTVCLRYRRCKCVSWNRVGYLSPNPSKRSTPI
jgi:acyl-CoA reductase-like NAD-dependent aldehyde dehydrogenase